MEGNKYGSKFLLPVDNNPTVSIDHFPYIHAATSDNTRLAYQADIADFLKKGWVLPATPEDVEAYLNHCAPNYNPRTLLRRMTSIRQWHRLQDCEDPTKHPRVIKTLRGIARLHGRPKKQAVALRMRDLDRMVEYLNEGESLQNIRNRALLLLGFFGAFRRSELVTLTWESVHLENDGLIITLRRSKTDQKGEGMQCIIPLGKPPRCAIDALVAWRSASRINEGPIFRRISKTGRVGRESITPQYFNRLIREVAQAVRLPQAAQMSSHSLRRGFATEAARLGASMPAIQRHGRWRSTKMVFEYIETGRQFSDSAVNVLFGK